MSAVGTAILNRFKTDIWVLSEQDSNEVVHSELDLVIRCSSMAGLVCAGRDTWSLDILSGVSLVERIKIRRFITDLQKARKDAKEQRILGMINRPIPEVINPIRNEVVV